MQRSLFDQPLFDQVQIALLRDALGEEELRAMLSEFPGTAALAFRNMGTALASNDLEEVRRVAHAFKGVASSFGASLLAAMARELETEAISSASMKKRMPALTRAIDETVAALPDIGRDPSAGAEV